MPSNATSEMRLSTMLNPVSQVSVGNTDEESNAAAIASSQEMEQEELSATAVKQGIDTVQSDAISGEQHDPHVEINESRPSRPADEVHDTDLYAMQIDGARSPKPRIKVETTVKTEPVMTPRENTPASAIEPSLDEATVKAIKEAQNEYSTRRVSRKPIIDRLLTPEPEMPKPAPSKKRVAAKMSSPAVDGAPTGIKKPPPKKHKVERSEDRNTPKLSKRSSTPSSTTGGGRGGSKQNTKGTRKSSIAGTTTSSSPAVASSPAAASETASDVEDNGEVYCICRRPDNHTFMIACDGGCDDWFHGKCVKIRKEDETLIDKYICPNCTAKEVGVTTWKPMCRREGCRRPARLKKGAESKYCTDECGVTFMKGQIRLAAAALPTAVYNDAGEEYLGPLGGPIRTHELKALVLAAPDYETFRRLGSSPLLTPPPSSPSPEAQKMKPSSSEPKIMNESPQASEANSRADSIADRLSYISTRKAFLRARHATLKDRERLVVMVKERAARLVASSKAKDTKTKDVCGYDSRLSWDDAVFAEWRQSPEGVAVFTAKTLDPPEDVLASVKTERAAGNGTGAGASPTETKSRPHTLRTSTSELVGGATAPEGAGPPGVCMRKRCQRHNGWQKLALHDVRFEEADVGAEMRRVGDEEVELRAKGVGMGKGAVAVAEETGWVEVVGVEDGGMEGVMAVKSRHQSAEDKGVDEEGDVVFAGTD